MKFKRDQISMREIEKEADLAETGGMVAAEQFYDDISEKIMSETAVDRTTSSIFNESRMVSESKLILEFEYETRAQFNAKKKKFRREHL